MFCNLRNAFGTGYWITLFIERGNPILADWKVPLAAEAVINPCPSGRDRTIR
jgi:hypothetical protein